MLPLTGLHTKIALRLSLLLLAAMVMIDLAVFMGAQKAMVRLRIAEGRQSLRLWPTGKALPGGALAAARFDGRLRPLVAAGTDDIRLEEAAQRQLRAGGDAVVFQGSTWGVFWRQPRQVLLAVPVMGPQGLEAAAAGIWSLEPLYHELRRMQPLMAGYMAVNLLMLALAGAYLIGRITSRPLQRLVRRAETYTDEADIFAAGSEDDQDYARLSRALNRIYGRITRDREALAATVARLETTNRQLKRAHQDMLRAEKLAAVGRLSAGLAHEIGNPLGIVTGYLELLGRRGLDSAQRRDIVRRTETEIGRIGRILRQLLDLARPSPEAATAFCLHDLIVETAQVFEHQPLTADVTLICRLTAGRHRVVGDVERLRQVFLNLMINAVDAIRETGDGRQGRLEISTENRDDRIVAALRDNGAGIDADRLPLIFDPFYTTKEPGQGTGLGLAVSFMIVEAIGGRMRAESRPGEGTTISVSLPLAPAETSGAEQTVAGGK